MGWVLMSERDVNRLEVLAQIDDGHLSFGNGGRFINRASAGNVAAS
jgi:hypothetical protein